MGGSHCEVMVMWILILMLGWVAGCAEQQVPQGRFTEAQFVNLCVDVLALQADDSFVSDSLLVARDRVYQKHGVVKEDVVRFIDQHKADPQAWGSVVALLKAQLGEQADIPLKAFQQTKTDSIKHKKTGQ
jgi:hypothetical protein